MGDLYEYGLLGLFVASFLAATVLPLSSEALLAAMIAGDFDIWACITAATLGNWLGGMSSYYIGYFGKWKWIEKYMKVPQSRVEKWQKRMEKYGGYFALICWAPVIGDVISIALGFARVTLWKVAIPMFIGKALRYVVTAWGVAALLN